jgi:ABC-type amino acid transport substrate-binding protein
MEWSGTIASVQSKRVDIMAGTMGWTEQRAKAMTLSDPIHYFKNGITQSQKTTGTS